MLVGDRADDVVGPVSQIDAGVLNVGYVERARRGPAVLLLHGWPYDIHSYAEVRPCWRPRATG